MAEKEGRKSIQVAELDDFYRGQREIKLFDPNITACADREKLFQQLIDIESWVDFTQGLDIRLIHGIESMVAKMKIKAVHFAWDNPNEDLRKYFKDFKTATGIEFRKLSVYVLTNFGNSMEENLYRIYTLRELGYDPYVMIYEKDTAPKEIHRLQRWVNNKIIFRSCEKFEDYRG